MDNIRLKYYISEFFVIFVYYYTASLLYRTRETGGVVYLPTIGIIIYRCAAVVVSSSKLNIIYNIYIYIIITTISWPHILLTTIRHYIII